MSQATRNGADIWLSIWLRHSQHQHGRALLTTMLSGHQRMFAAPLWQTGKVCTETVKYAQIRLPCCMHACMHAHRG